MLENNFKKELKKQTSELLQSIEETKTWTWKKEGLLPIVP